MHTGDEYRAKAAALTAQVTDETAPSARKEIEILVRSYLRLAEQADLNDQTDVVYVTPPPPH